MLEMHQLVEGMTFAIQKVVDYHDTTVAFGRSGIETLLSTPALVGMMIESAVELVGKRLPEGYITVVKNMELSHLKPTLQGMTVTVKATLDEIAGDTLKFSFQCFDELGEIAHGTQKRKIVNKAGLLSRARERAAILEDQNR